MTQAARGLQDRLDYAKVELVRFDDTRLKKISARMVAELQSDQAELKALAGRLDLKWPESNGRHSREKIEEMRKSRPRQGERAILKRLRQSVQTDLALYERAEQSESLDPSLRRWASGNLNDLRESVAKLSAMEKAR